MNIIAFNGSPHKNGNTSFMINQLVNGISANIKIVNCHKNNIKSCVDCGYCKNNIGCVIKDDMQDLYKEIEHADCIVIASPIYFSSLTGDILNVLSRFQMFYCNSRFLKINHIKNLKTGIILLNGGGEGKADAAVASAKIVLKMLKCDKIHIASSLSTDDLPADKDAEVLKQLKKIKKDVFDNTLDLIK